MYDSSKDALAAIMREHGAEVLLGSRLRNFFLDYAHVKAGRKKSHPKPAPARTTLGNLMPGQRNVSFGKYLWCVLDVQNGRALLLAEEVLEQRLYHSEYTSVTWETCELRKYLNGEFLRSFSSQERKRIAKTENVNKDNQWFETFGGSSTVDRVFLLSIEEVVKYFGDSGDLREWMGWGYRVYEWPYIYDQYNSARIAKYRGVEAFWWLRSPGCDNDRAAGVSYEGYLSMSGLAVHHVDSEDVGVRPALWLNLESGIFSSVSSQAKRIYAAAIRRLRKYISYGEQGGPENDICPREKALERR